MDQFDMEFGVFERIRDSFPELERMELHGEGEPMLSPHFFDMASMASENGVRVSAITNGSLFSSNRIEKLLDSGIQALFISIESPREAEFGKIRGGSLAKVKRGIRELLDVRNARGQSTPSVGFSATVLKSTRDQLGEIADLYLELNMDGGVSMHMLNTMPDYLQFYTQGMETQTLNATEQALTWLRYSRMMQNPLYASARMHFSDIVFGQLYANDANNEPRLQSGGAVREYRSCPWLDHALYVNRHGSASGCARIKNTGKYGFGNIKTDSTESILSHRREMSDQVRAGEVPDACRGCFIAESINHRMTKLLGRKPRRLKSSVSEEIWAGGNGRAAGLVKYEPEAVRIVLECSDGRRTGQEIIDHIAVQWCISPDEARRRVFPVLGELIRFDAITCKEAVGGN